MTFEADADCVVLDGKILSSGGERLGGIFNQSEVYDLKDSNGVSDHEVTISG